MKGKRLNEVMQWGLVDIFTMITILVFIGLTYQNRYGTTAGLYLKNQLELFASHCITCMSSLYIYYFLENKFHFDKKYAGGIILTFFFLVSGVGGKSLYRIYFHKKEDRYNPTREEYLVITSTVFIVVTLKLVSEGIIQIVVPFALLLGRFIWIDTSSLKDIKDSVIVQHKKIIETATLFIVGMVILSIVMPVFQLPRAAQPLIAVLYGIIILYPVEKMKPNLYKVIQCITRRKDSR